MCVSYPVCFFPWISCGEKSSVGRPRQDQGCGDQSPWMENSAPLLIRLLTCWNIALPQHSSRFRWPLKATHREVDVKLYPCAFFSHCLSQAERNYDMELFVIRQEGKAHTLVIWMDHKNLVYRQIAKWLNAHQVRLHRFCWRFKLLTALETAQLHTSSVTYRPCFPPSLKILWLIRGP